MTDQVRVATVFAPEGNYTGRLVNNKADGKGTFSVEVAVARRGPVPGCAHYDGEWLEGQMNGRGRGTWIDGSVYDGEWRGGVQEGWGWRSWPDGSSYIGQSTSGHWTHGIWRHPNGVDRYEGGWAWDSATHDNVREGWGVQSRRGASVDEFDFVSAIVYSGYEWQNDQMHGRGMWRSPETGCCLVTRACSRTLGGAMLRMEVWQVPQGGREGVVKWRQAFYGADGTPLHVMDITLAKYTSTPLQAATTGVLHRSRHLSLQLTTSMVKITALCVMRGHTTSSFTHVGTVYAVLRNKPPIRTNPQFNIESRFCLEKIQVGSLLDNVNVQ
ncbi:hypothetical protein Pelo_8991 [Pelomyxa schiedti]|nr:hypothetical protein Pelo_8991 [Pelomyxa schiedti]